MSLSSEMKYSVAGIWIGKCSMTKPGMASVVSGEHRTDMDSTSTKAEGARGSRYAFLRTGVEDGFITGDTADAVMNYMKAIEEAVKITDDINARYDACLLYTSTGHRRLDRHPLR